MSVPSHHKRQDLCSSRAPYREGKKPKAVKVYTVNQESKYLLVQGVPAVGTSQELVKLFAIHGAISEYRILDDYPAEHFTEIYLIKFEKIQAARMAKRKLDDWSFFGGVLHVCYAPEYESIQETREKLQDRRKVIAAKVRQYEKDGTYSSPYSSTSHKITAAQTPETSKVQREVQRSHSKTHAEDLEVSNKQIREELHSDSLYLAQTFETEHTEISDQSNVKVEMYNTQMYQYPAETNIAPNFSGVEQVSNNMSTNAGKWQNLSAEVTKFSHPSSNIESNSEKAPTSENRFSDIYQWNNTTNTSENAAPEEQLQLPLPPKQMHHGMSRHNKRLWNYEFAHVPTAQAEFPVGFDARVDQGRDTEVKLSISQTQKELQQSSSAAKPDSADNNTSAGKTDAANNVQDAEKRKESRSMQEQIEENLKNKKDLVIKDLEKNRPVPKFIPRQAQIKKKHNVNTEPSKQKSIEADELNREIKKNAFKLGNPQGPITPSSELVKEVRETELSVDKSVKDIRKRMMQLSENKELLSKKKRLT